MSRRNILFMVVAVVAVAALYAVFKLRYGWYTTDGQASFLNIGFGIFLLALVASWILYPTRIGVAILGAVVVIFPCVVQPEKFVALDLPFLAYAVVPILLLVLATRLRQRS